MKPTFWIRTNKWLSWSELNFTAAAAIMVCMFSITVEDCPDWKEEGKQKEVGLNHKWDIKKIFNVSIILLFLSRRKVLWTGQNHKLGTTDSAPCSTGLEVSRNNSKAGKGTSVLPVVQPQEQKIASSPKERKVHLRKCWVCAFKQM